MRIAIIAHLKHPIGEPFAGGLEMHTHMLASSLRDRGHDITVFASTRSDPSIGTEAICDETALLETGIAEATDVTFFREHHAYLTLMSTLRHRDFDLIHNNSLHYLPVTLADTLAAPMVTTLHTPPFCWLESGIRQCRGANVRFVAISDAIQTMWSPIVQIDRLVENGVDLSRFPFRAKAAQKPYLVWYGRIVPEKGLDCAVEAARLLDMELRIAGPISNREWFDAEIAPKLGKKAIYVGHLDHDALARLIGGARAFLCTPRWEEPYGLVVAEALSCGTPVAAFARGAIPSILNEMSGVLAVRDDPRALADAARRAMRLDRGDCRRRAERRCDAAHMITGYEALYEDVLREWRSFGQTATTTPALAAA